MTTQEEKKRQEELIAAISVLIVMKGVPTPSLANKIAILMKAAGLVVAIEVLYKVTALAVSKPIISGPTAGRLSAVSIVQGREDAFRAMYLVAGTRRVQESLARGMTLEQAMDKEHVNWEQHLEAQRKRYEAAAKVDKAATRYGPLLGWYATLDNRTSEECEAANGHNFSVTEPPAIGFPGSVHRSCRCKPGKPHKGATLVDSVKAARKVA